MRGYFRSQLLCIVALGTVVWSCSSSEEKSSRTNSGEDSGKEQEPAQDEDTGSDEPAWVNSLFLSLDCVPESENQDAGRYSMFCQIRDKAGKAIAPDSFSSDYSWEVSGTGSASNVTITEEPAQDHYGARITVGTSSYVTPGAMKSLEVRFVYVDKVSKKSATINKRLDTIFAGLANQKYFRFSIMSIRDHDPLQALESITSLEVKIDGNWHMLNQNQTTMVLTIGDKIVEADAEATDLLMFGNIFGINTPALPAATFTRFSANADFDATNPLQLVFGDGVPQSITGFRYNGGTPLTSTNVPAGFPDKFMFETSADKIKWTEVPGSRIDVESLQDADVLEFIWTGSESSTTP